MQVPQGKATVPLLPAHLRCTHLPLKCPQGDRPQDEARQSGASTVEDRAASSSWGLLAPAASPFTDTATVAYFHIKIQGRCVGVQSGSSSTTPNYNSHEAGASAYLQAPYYEKLTAVVVYEVVGSVTIPYACILCACMLPCPSWGL